MHTVSKEAAGTIFFLVRKDVGHKFDFYFFFQLESEIYARLERLAERHGLSLDDDQDGLLIGRPPASKLRAAFLDPDFLPNVELRYAGTLIRQDGLKSWPARAIVGEFQDAPLEIIEDLPRWTATEVSTPRGLECGLQFGRGDLPDEAPIVIHQIDDTVALETRWPRLPEFDGGPASHSLSWQIDGGRRHRMTARRDLLIDDALVVRPFEPRLLVELGLRGCLPDRRVRSAARQLRAPGLCPAGREPHPTGQRRGLNIHTRDCRGLDCSPQQSDRLL